MIGLPEWTFAWENSPELYFLCADYEKLMENLYEIISTAGVVLHEDCLSQVSNKIMSKVDRLKLHLVFNVLPFGLNIN